LEARIVKCREYLNKYDESKYGLILGRYVLVCESNECHLAANSLKVAKFCWKGE
jgi:hypothetical protein